MWLSLRSVIVFFLSLYTSRIVLDALGIEEYGIYQVIVGIVGAITFLKSSLQQTAQRFLSYTLTEGNELKLQKVFSTQVLITLCFSVVVFVVIQIAGIFIFDTGIQTGAIDTHSLRIVLLIVSLSVVMTLMVNPYVGLLIAHEHMQFVAIINVFGAVLRLACCYILYIIQTDRLIAYAVLLCVVSVLERIVLVYTCKKNYREATLVFQIDKQIIREMLSYSGWTSLSALSNMIRTYGITILINIFFGPIINATMGIAQQVRGAILTLLTNVQSSFAPQIVKNYAQENYEAQNTLLHSGTKIITYMSAILIVPIIIEIEYILQLWLKQIPPYTSVFVVLILHELYLKNIASLGNTAIRATGKVKQYEIVYNTIELLLLPCLLIVMHYNSSVYVPSVCLIVFALLSSAIKICFMQKVLPTFNARNYIAVVILKPLVIILVSALVPVTLWYVLPSSLLRLGSICVLYVLVLGIIVYYFDLTESEKKIIKNITHKTSQSA